MSRLFLLFYYFSTSADVRLQTPASRWARFRCRPCSLTEEHVHRLSPAHSPGHCDTVWPACRSCDSTPTSSWPPDPWERSWGQQQPPEMDECPGSESRTRTWRPACPRDVWVWRRSRQRPRCPPWAPPNTTGSEGRSPEGWHQLHPSAAFPTPHAPCPVQDKTRL